MKKSKKNFEVLNDSFPTIYRIDRIRELKILDEKFFIYHTETDSKRESLENEFSLCTVANLET